MSFRQFFDMDNQKTDMKRLTAFILVVGGVLIGGIAVILDKFTTEVATFAGALVAAGVGLVSKIIYDAKNGVKNDDPPSESL